MPDQLPVTPADASEVCATCQGLAPGALGQALLQLLGQLNAGWNIKDATTGRYLHLNGTMAELLGVSVAEAVGRVDAELPDAAAWLPLRAAEQYAATQTHAQTQVHHIELRGQLREFSVVRMALATEGEKAPHLLGSAWIEQTAHRQREQQLQLALRQLEQQAQAPDPALASAPEQSRVQLRAQFDDQLRRELDLSNREHREFALVSVALDPLSDELLRHGEVARQRIHQAVARLLRSNTRAMDAACELDPSRFAILLSGVGLATAHSRIEGLRRQCATEIIAIDGQDLRFTVSMGVASYPHTAQDREALIEAADAALAQAQRRGGNHVALASIRFELR
jgi:diguanylate cyclase (GGDEF)-like protein